MVVFDLWEGEGHKFKAALGNQSRLFHAASFRFAQRAAIALRAFARR
jgi:hypothetical protein